MLDVAFYETPDYRSLIESTDKTVVVGRRGTGKSALVYRLHNYWHGVDNTRVISISFEEEQVIGMCPEVELFGSCYRFIRSGCRVAWRYCLAAEIALALSPYYRFDKADEDGVLRRHLGTWRKLGHSITARLRRLLELRLTEGKRPETQIADLAEALELHTVEAALQQVLASLQFNCIVLIDRLDPKQAYSPGREGGPGA